MAEKSGDYWKSAAAVYRDWRSGKKMLSDMTDGDLQMFDNYLHVVLVGREFRRLELEMQPSRRFPGRLRKVLLFIPVAFFVLFLLSGLHR